jgi:superfamily II DNA or RNA helicase
LDYRSGTTISDSIDYEFQGELRESQKRVAEGALYRPYGVVSLPTGVGKTVVALHCIAERKQKTLVVIEKSVLLEQWRDRITEFLGIPKSEIGVIGGSKWKIGEKITVATMQTLASQKSDISELVNQIGFLVVDECHHVPADTFQKVMAKFRCRYMLGLSATLERADGLGDLTHFYMGDTLYHDTTERAFQRGDILRPRVRIVWTGFSYAYKGDHAAMLKAIAEDPDRLELLVDVVSGFITRDGTPGIPLIVSDRIEHCKRIAEALGSAPEEFKVGLLTSDVKQKRREQIIGGVKSGELDALVATSSLIGEGFDCKEVDGLFLTTPFKAASRVQQMVGRIVRPYEGKPTPEIYDFVDLVPHCRRQFDERLKVYREQRYAVDPGLTAD